MDKKEFESYENRPKTKKLLIIYRDKTKTMPVEVWIDNKLLWVGGEYWIKYLNKT